MWNPLDEITNAGVSVLRCFCSCLFLLACTGPILLIVGIVLISSPNHRIENVNAYNHACMEWYKERGESTFRATNFTVNNVAMNKEPYTQGVIVSGSLDGVMYPEAFGLYYEIVTSSVYTSTTSFTVTSSSSKANSGYSTTFLYDAFRYKYVEYTCRKTNGCYDTTVNDCPYGYSYDYTQYKRNCKQSETCGRCVGKSYLSNVCVPFQPSGIQYIADGMMKSCTYPFRSQTYLASTQTTNIPVRIRPSRDPYMTLERLTDGSMNFGMDRAQQTKLGVTLLIIGGIITGLVYGSLALVCFRNRQQVTQMSYQAMGR